MHLLGMFGQKLFTGRSFQSEKKLENIALGFGKDKILPSLKFLSAYLCLVKKKEKESKVHLMSLWQLGCN